MSGFVINFEGELVQARAGESVAAALTAHGIRGFRITRSTAERGIFCGMGVCQDCLVEVDGIPGKRAFDSDRRAQGRRRGGGAG